MLLGRLKGKLRDLKMRVGGNSLGVVSDKEEGRRLVADRRLLAVVKGADAGAGTDSDAGSGAGSEGRWAVVVGKFIEEVRAFVDGA